MNTNTRNRAIVAAVRHAETTGRAGLPSGLP